MQTGEGHRVEISIVDQRLRVFDQDVELREFIVSTSKFGVGTDFDSYKTPTGEFEIGAKIGEGEEIGTIFRSRSAVGVFDFSEPSSEDLILTRILWLNGLEEHNANTCERYIYIHGTNHENVLGQPTSCGCIRMFNEDIVELFDMLDVGSYVVIAD